MFWEGGRGNVFFMEGQGVGGYVGFESSLSLCFFLPQWFQRFPCSALNVKVVRISKQAPAQNVKADEIQTSVGESSFAQIWC